MRTWAPWFLLASLGCCCPAPAQPAAKIQPLSRDAAEPLLRIDASLVLVPVYVVDSFGAPVAGLSRDNFRIFEDRTEETVASFSVEDAPVSIGLLLDTSGSMKFKLSRAADAAATLIRTSNPQDEFCVVEFNDRSKLTAGFTTDPDEIYQQIAHTRAHGHTALIDAVCTALAQMRNARYSRKAIVVISDGGDNWSRHSARQVRETLIESDVAVYAMGVFDADIARRPSEERNGPLLLEDLSRQTGGELYRVDSVDELPAVSQRIARRLRSIYMLGYYSTNPERDGKYRRLEVHLESPDAPRLHLTYRRGYYAPADALR